MIIIMMHLLQLKITNDATLSLQTAVSEDGGLIAELETKVTGA